MVNTNTFNTALTLLSDWKIIFVPESATIFPVDVMRNGIGNSSDQVSIIKTKVEAVDKSNRQTFARIKNKSVEKRSFRSTPWNQIISEIFFNIVFERNC